MPFVQSELKSKIEISFMLTVASPQALQKTPRISHVQNPYEHCSLRLPF